MGVYSLIQPGDLKLAQIEKLAPKALILSGGPSSVYDKGAPKLAPGLLNWIAKNKIPVLGICYGMQLLVRDLGGKVGAAHKREYGRMTVQAEGASRLLGPAKKFQAWMSHGDEIQALPKQFTLKAKSAQGAPALIECESEKLYAIQFHPEVTHTEGGQELLKRFVKDISGIQPDWNMRSVIDDQIEKVKQLVGPKDHAICALSGGVDSTVAATLIHKAIGDRLHCVFVDHGLLRFEEQARVMKLFKERLHLPVECVDASKKFLSKLKGVTDPERKRKIIGAEFIATFDESSKKLAKKLKLKPKYLVQGTLYPDVIESSPPPSEKGGKKHSVTIKSHHNVGGLPKKMGFTLIEPLRDLFKDEVRKLGKELGVPPEFLERHPFPGPGLGVRIIGDITRERVALLQKVDEVFIRSIREAGLYDKIWQAFAVFLPIRSVGVQGDGRTHDHVVALRAVTSTDGMTADWYHFDPQFLADVSSRICNEVKGVNRVVYDISSKPPATIEWE